MSFLDARLLVVLDDGRDAVEVFLSSHQSVRALSILAQVWSPLAGVAGAAGIGFASIALLASPSLGTTALGLTLGL